MRNPDISGAYDEQRCKDIERSIIKKYRKEIWCKFTKAINTYKLISDGDKIAVCISGGKDSMLMAKLFQEILRHGKKNFDVVFLVMNPGYNKLNYDLIMTNATIMGIPVQVFESDIFDVTSSLVEGSPCYLCARMRRGALYAKAKELGCNKIALGHHYDDAAETLMLNLFYEGRIGCFRPVTYLSRSDMTVIRPMILTEERQIKSFVKKAALPVEATPCPEDSHTEREEMKTLLHSLDRKHRGIYRRIVGALERSGLDGWKEE